MCDTDLLIALAATMSQEHFKLLIMDSVMAHLRVDFSGRGELSERQQKLGILMSRLRKVTAILRLLLVTCKHTASSCCGYCW